MNKIYEKQGMSAFDAFLALEDIEDEEVLTEAKSFNLRDKEDMSDAEQFREEDQKTENVTLEVIDPDADAIEHMKNGEEYVGQMILQCNACKATMFINMDKLEQSETDDDLYNMETECPHCHTVNTGYTIVGQVGKAEEPAKEEQPEEAAAENDEVDGSDMSFDNDVESENKEEGSEETTEEGSEKETDKAEPEETFAWDETDSEDDTEDEEPESEDEESEDEEDEDKKKKEESLTEDGEDEVSKKQELKNKIKKAMGISEGLTEAVGMTPEEAQKFLDEQHCLSFYDACQKYKNLQYDIEKENFGTYDAWSEATRTASKFSRALNALADTSPENKRDYNHIVMGWNESLEEELDLNSWEGTVESFLNRFTLEDQRLAINFYNTEEDKLAAFDSAEDVSFDFSTANVEEFNTDDDYISINVSEPTDDDPEDVCSVATLFERFKDNETTTFRVSNLDTEEETEVETVDELIEQFGAMNIEGAIEVQNLNFYIMSDMEAESSEETVEESLIRNIISENNLRQRKANQINTVEYFISESITNKEDLDKIYEEFIAPCDSPMLTHQFKNVTGYKDHVDTFLEDKNITREQYDVLLESNNDLEQAKNLISKYGTFEEACRKYLDINSSVTGNAADDLSYQTYQRLLKERSELSTALEKVAETDPQANETYKKLVIDRLAIKAYESLFKSVKNRNELSEVLEVLQTEKIPYQVKRSTNEEYRYDIFLTGKPQVLTEEVDPEITATDVPTEVSETPETVSETEFETPETEVETGEVEEVDLDPEEEDDFDEDKFDNAVNDFFMESYGEPLTFRTISGEQNEDGTILIHGIVEDFDKDMKVTFTLTPKNINESNDSEVGYTVSNDISEEVFDYNLD